MFHGYQKCKACKILLYDLLPWLREKSVRVSYDIFINSPFFTFSETMPDVSQQTSQPTLSSPLMQIESFLDALTNADKNGRIVICKQSKSFLSVFIFFIICVFCFKFSLNLTIVDTFFFGGGGGGGGGGQGVGLFFFFLFLVWCD